jgi:hypothetical protein
MTPRIGVYEYDSHLFESLFACFYCISNRDLLFSLTAEPFQIIRDGVLSGSAGEYVLREKHRRWTENIEEHIGIWVPLPTFELLCETEEWADECGMADAFYCDMAEWMFFGDDVDIAYGLIEKLPYTVWMNDDIEEVVKQLLALRPDIKDLIVVSRDLFAIYVIRSEKIENHGIEVTDLASTGFHAFSDLANAVEKGDYPSYVFDDKVAEAYANELKFYQEYEEKREERRRTYAHISG